MFDKADGSYALGTETARLVEEWVGESRKGRMGFWEGEKGTQKAAAKGKGKEKTEL